MFDKLIEIKDERGIEFYLDPKIGRNNDRERLEEYKFTRTYLLNLIESMGFDAKRIGFHADIDTMTTFLGNIIIKYQEHFNEDIEDLY